MSAKRGLTFMVAACLLSALMGVPIRMAHLRDPELSSVVTGFVRILMNCFLVFSPLALKSQGREMLREKRAGLWLWGIFGAITVYLYFAALARIPMGEVSFLYASSALVITVLRPILLKQKNSMMTWVAVAGGWAGVFLVQTAGKSISASSGQVLLGRSYALASGVTAGLAFLMVAKSGTKVSAKLVMRYWCVCCLTLYGFFLLRGNISLPDEPRVWGLIVIAGILASYSQYFTTLAFQFAPAAPVAAVGYLTPIFALVFDGMVFGYLPSTQALVGAACIVFFGVFLPFLRAETLKPLSA